MSDYHVFENAMEKAEHDKTKEMFTLHAVAINEVIKPYIINSVKKKRFTKGLGWDSYDLPRLLVRPSTDEEDGKGIPHYVIEADIVNPKTNESLIVSMPIGQPDKVKALDFAVFAEKVKEGLNLNIQEKGLITEKGIII